MDITTLKLWSNFIDYEFFEDKHYYTYKGLKVSTSVTQLIETLSIPFDSDKWSQHIAKKEGKSQQEVLDDWKRKADVSCNVGTIFHERSEQLCFGKHLNIDYKKYNKDLIDDIKKRVNKLTPLQDKFFKDIKGKLFPLKCEFTVGLDSFIAGNIDLIAWNDKDQEIQLWDYKTNKEIKFTNSYGNKLLFEFSDLDDCEYNKYSIQLNIYKYIIKKVLGIDIGKCYIAFFNENNKDYQIILCADFQDRVGRMFNRILRETSQI